MAPWWDATFAHQEILLAFAPFPGSFLEVLSGNCYINALGFSHVFVVRPAKEVIIAWHFYFNRPQIHFRLFLQNPRW
jgi:hypothetical protein